MRFSSFDCDELEELLIFEFGSLNKLSEILDGACHQGDVLKDGLGSERDVEECGKREPAEQLFEFFLVDEFTFISVMDAREPVDVGVVPELFGAKNIGCGLGSSELE